MAIINLKSVVEEFKVKGIYHITYQEGYYDYNRGGHYVEGQKIKAELNPATLVDRGVTGYGEGGTYQGKVTRLYCYTRLKEGENIEYKDVKYSIKDVIDYSDQDSYKDGLYIYTLEVV